MNYCISKKNVPEFDGLFYMISVGNESVYLILFELILFPCSLMILLALEVSQHPVWENPLPEKETR